VSSKRILIVEDDDSVRTALVDLFTEAGYSTETAVDGPQAIIAVKDSTFQLHIIDLQLPDKDGIEVLTEIKKIDPRSVCIVLTAYGTIELAVKAVKAGAFDFITKPFQCNAVLTLVKTALEHSWMDHPNPILHKAAHDKGRFESIIGRGPKMERIYELIEKVSDSDSTILIQGESGTGKEVVAKTIHRNSPRQNKPFIPLNCGAIPEALLESELFGHERGAFTGAISSRIGRFELANGGTLFLDEVSEMPLSLQVKLLRVLQEREFERVGGTRSIRVDVRIIAATNQDLEQAVAEKRFRRDLFYRLNIIPINLPSLRERREDIPLLTDHFINKFNEKKRRNIQGISPDAQKLLLKYSWPGNVRELENLIEQMITLKQEGIITPADLPDKLFQSQEHSSLPQFEISEEGINFQEAVMQFEKQMLQQALLKANGVKNRAAQLLHLNRTTLVEKLKRQGLTVTS
jgi:DNA-binding NtrC family response regulator